MDNEITYDDLISVERQFRRAQKAPYLGVKHMFFITFLPEIENVYEYVVFVGSGKKGSKYLDEIDWIFLDDNLRDAKFKRILKR